MKMIVFSTYTLVKYKNTHLQVISFDNLAKKLLKIY